MQVDVVENRDFFVVGKADVLEPDVATEGAGLRAGTLGFALRPGGVRFHGRVEDLENPLPGGAPGLDQLVELVQTPDRVVEEPGQDEEGDQIADFQGSL